jgi:hypothetical protein
MGAGFHCGIDLSARSPIVDAAREAIRYFRWPATTASGNRADEGLGVRQEDV